MSFGPKDLIIYTLVGLTLAVIVNSAAGLNNPFLNSIERAIVPPSQRGLKNDKKHFDYTSSQGATTELSDECMRYKTKGDSKTIVRAALREAISQKDTYRQRELEEQLRDMENAEREACR